MSINRQVLLNDFFTSIYKIYSGLTYQRANTTVIQSTLNVSSSPFDVALHRFALQNTNNEVNNNNKQLINLDWTNDLTAFETPKKDTSILSRSSMTINQKEHNDNAVEDEEDIVVTLNKTEYNTPIGVYL